MRFSPLIDEYAMYHRIGSENGLVEMFVYPVIFGFRVRAGFVGSMAVELDWCAGANWEDVERLYSICRSILIRRDEHRDCFQGIPRYSKVKPFFMDREFTEHVLNLAGDIEPIQLDPIKVLYPHEAE